MSKKKQNVDLKHLSIEQLDILFGNIQTGYMNRRDLITRGVKMIGGIAMGSAILSHNAESFAAVRWKDDKKSDESISEKQEPNETHQKWNRSKVVIVQDTKSVDSSGIGKDGPVHDMIMKAIIQLTGENDPSKAWRQIAGSGQRVGLKVNCIAGRGLSTQVPVVMAIVHGLKLAGVLDKDIIIWDRSDRELTSAGYEVQKSNSSLRCYGTPSYDEKEYDINGSKFKLSSILIDEIDILINVPVMKNHGGAGVTLSLKNHYGSINNPGSHHGNNCDPAIANINSHPAIKNKTRLIVCDALRAQCNGGPSSKPQWQWYPGQILMSFDPVALDRIGGDIIDQRRKEVGIDLLGNRHSHIATASKLKLGDDNRNLIDTQKIVVN